MIRQAWRSRRRDGAALAFMEANTSTTPNLPLLYTLTEAAETLRISRTKLYELLDSHQLESVHIGRSRKIPADVLHAYISQLRTQEGT